MGEDVDPSDDLSRWESILAEADIKSIPVNFLKEVNIRMMDGTEEIFNIKSLKKRGLKVKEIEALLEAFVDKNDEDIDTLDFVLNVEELAKVVGKKTKRLLG
jgi:hypothetical protein